MAKAITHIIRKLVVEVNTDTAGYGYAIKEDVRAFIDEYVLPAIENYLMQLEGAVSENEVVEVDSLVIDLQVDKMGFNDPKWQWELDAAMEKMIRPVLQTMEEQKVLSGCFEASENTLQSTGLIWNIQDKTGPREQSFTEDVDSSKQMDSTKQNNSVPSVDVTSQNVVDQGLRILVHAESARMVEALCYFFETGKKPWWMPSNEAMNRMFEPVVFRQAIETEIQRVRNWFFQNMRRSMVLNRLMNQLESDQLFLFLELVFLDEVAFANRPSELQLSEVLNRLGITPKQLVFGDEKWIGQLMQMRSETHHQREKTALSFAVSTWINAVSHTASEDMSDLLLSREVKEEVITGIAGLATWMCLLADGHSQSITSSYIRQREANVKEILSRLSFLRKQKGSGTAKPVSGKVTDGWITEVMEQLRSKDTLQFEGEKRIVKNPDTPEMLSERKEEHAPFAIRDAEQHAIFENETNAAAEEEEESGVYVSTAGLVILYPFLKYFFKDVDLLDDQNRLTDAHLAAHVLHYIATGNEQPYEYALVFEKFLLDIPLQESVPKELVIPQVIKEKVALLFDAVRENWPPVQGTSAEGLQETFLMREGKLVVTDDVTRLIIERKTVDILLDQLGWPISLIHFPWKKGVVYVEW